MKNYDNFFLPSGNLEESCDFYEKILGLNLKFDFSDMGMVAYKVGQEEPAIILKDVSRFPDFKPTIWFEVDNVSDTYRDLKAKGVVFFSEPFRIKTGWAVEFSDPSGNRLGITDYNKE
ncbi:putative enzyme related to lactoylglutathione lyase [Dysgonomonas sp. PFB1-18]|jgi:predicted enzyme related to lactoylglutathione lyase|uniref:VOC family protein n=1 Tax=unclassified Dysgonomonas TaxID=2630389 RepID=UPI002476E3AD|nr:MULTISPECIES: VOC family protein [unclassified Dysgonomonas]MDH6310358.1 putative enzyme related to lactoylglutathione lyase [Dysgonomonas sp. PF1-14]MDH6340312.1 putative enzyme related to lactoylglutathione lyase [Dysgonomonas sp. PF1-16]MDH6381908.1 putative enzyme related to lactoylglutathione lyase [Dysgonomonas sp. PFB1-18]MDH6399283.1 putative enzyme related to lactoylglutathione lyase [Dysgonomonas sp. PF1-23]